ncbi:MAG: pyruvate kinase [Bacteroidia bacterium]|nr:pyruvate kinase [Bacteroidia bacterium]MCZ2278472.1 pyruvate kinase [Bacteroidia bacterium]
MKKNLCLNRTKIVATVGPASSSEEILTEMVRQGVNVFRINASHGEQASREKLIRLIRKINRKLNSHVAVLFDLQGPKIRIGEVLNNSVLLEEKKEVILTANEWISDSNKIYIKYKQLTDDVVPGDTVLIDDGKIELVVLSKKKNHLIAKVVHGGMLSSRKGVNLPYTKISLPSLTEKDKVDLDFALKMQVEWIGLSFVRKAKDINELKEIILSKAGTARVIAKIEKPDAIQDIDNIIAATDGLMVARGDLGVEMPMQRVPLIQKMLVRKCIAASKPIIIATQMMESMISNYRPTRAEANDVANAVFDGADALMLSAETSLGEYPVKTVEAMHKIIAMCEREDSIYHRHQAPEKNSPTFISDSTCYNACLMAEQSNAKAILGMTHSGYTAFQLSAERPKAAILIFTDNKPILNMLSLVWGVQGFFYNKYISTDNTISDQQQMMLKSGILEKGDITIHVASMPLKNRGMANTIKIGLAG